jgi:ketosteroid isomerase-like protein
MPQENIAIVRAVIDAFNRRNWEAALEPLDPDFELDFSRAIGPVGGVFKLDQARAFLDEFFGLWEAVRFEVDEFIEAGDQVATSFTNYHRGRDGIELKVRPSGVWTFRDGRIVYGCFYQEWQEALEAVGLSERDAHAD